MELMKDSIKTLKGYHPSNLPFEIKLDANEGRNIVFEKGFKFGEGLSFNFYPDSDARQLRYEIGKYMDVQPSKLIVGNGSSEMLDLIMKTFVDKGEGVLSFIPSFSMYSVYSQIYAAKFIGVESEKDFSLDMSQLIERAQEVQPKVILVCNPNNPTGYRIEPKEIKRLLESTNALVVVDEAYMEFSEGSMVDELKYYHNLVILRTLSKAFGLAGIRLGYMIANENVIEIVNRVKSPYNLNVFTQYIGIQALQRKDRVKGYIEGVKQERERVYKGLRSMGFKVYRSFGNFLFFRSNIENFYDKLAERGILIRCFSGELKGYYRVSIGDQDENDQFMVRVKEIVANEKG